MITLLTITGFIITSLSIFFLKGNIYIKADPYFEITLPYVYLVITIFTSILTSILLYRIMRYIVQKPMNIYEDYKKNQLIKNEKNAMTTYIKWLKLQYDNKATSKDKNYAITDYLDSAEVLVNNNLYWLLFCSMSAEVPARYKSVVQQDNELRLAYAYYQYNIVKNNEQTAETSQKILSIMLSIKDLTKELSWYYHAVVYAYLQLHDFAKALSAYQDRVKYIGIDTIMEADLYWCIAVNTADDKLKNAKKAYDITLFMNDEDDNLRNTYNERAVKFYIEQLYANQEFKVAFDILKSFLNKADFIQSFSQISKQVIFSLNKPETALQELNRIMHGRANDAFHFFCSELYIKFEMYTNARELLIQLSNTSYNAKAACLLIYIDAKIRGDTDSVTCVIDMMDN